MTPNGGTVTPNPVTFGSLAQGADFRDPRSNSDYIKVQPYTLNGNPGNAINMADGSIPSLYADNISVIPLKGTYDL